MRNKDSCKRIKCDICDKIFVTKDHIKKHNITNVDDYYYNLFFNQYKYNVDDVIISYKEGLSILDIKIKFNYSFTDIQKILDYKKIKKRNLKDSKHTSQYIEKQKNTVIEKYGVDNISKSNIVKEKKKATMYKNYGRINNFCDINIRKSAFDKIDYEVAYKMNLDTILKKYGVNNISKVDFVREKISKSQKERLSKMTDEEKRNLTKTCRTFIKHKNISKLELKIQSILNDLNIPYKCNYFIFGYQVDLLFDKKILEIMGDFWHGNPNIYKSDDIINIPGCKVKAEELWHKDEIKKNKLEGKGYEIYYLWETDINKMSDVDIMNFINKLL